MIFKKRWEINIRSMIKYIFSMIKMKYIFQEETKEMVLEYRNMMKYIVKNMTIFLNSGL